METAIRTRESITAARMYAAHAVCRPQRHTACAGYTDSAVLSGRDSIGDLCHPAGRNATGGTATPEIPAVWIIPLLVDLFGLWVISNLREFPLVGAVPVVRLFGLQVMLAVTIFPHGTRKYFILPPDHRFRAELQWFDGTLVVLATVVQRIVANG